MSLLKTIFYFFERPLARIGRESWAFLFPKWYVKKLYKKYLGKRLNLKNPRDLNEKIQWLKLFSDTTQWTQFADKYKVRKYVEQCGLGHILPQLYGVWRSPEEIDFKALPEKFVLKANHTYGRAVIVKDKSKINEITLRAQFNKWIKDRYGLISFEPHCWNIERRIIAEELLEDRKYSNFSSSIIDFKFWCFHGEPYLVMLLYDRNNQIIGDSNRPRNSHVQACIYDLNWELRPEIISGSHAHDKPLVIPKPESFDEMIHVAKLLSKPFPQVRVDLYEINNKVYFGELTFTSLGGYMDYFSDELLLKMGSKIDLSKANKRKGIFIV